MAKGGYLLVNFMSMCLFVIICTLGLGGGFVYLAYHAKRQVALLQSQKVLLKTLLNSCKEGLCWWHCQDKQVNYTAQFARIFNIKLGQALSVTSIIEHFDPIEGHQLLEDLNKLSPTHLICERTLRIKDQSRWISLRGSFLPCKEEGIVCLSAEIYQEVPLEENVKNLKRDRDHLRLMLDTLPIAVWYRGETGHINLCNSAYAGFVECSPQEAAERGIECINPERQNSPYHLAVKAKMTRLKQSLQNHIVVAGVRRLITFTEVPIEGEDTSVGFAIDSTEIEEIQEKLVKHIASYKEVLQLLSTPVAVYGHDTKLQFFNQAYQKLYGFNEGWLYTQPTFSEVLENLRTRRKLPEQQDFPTYKRECLSLFNNLLQPQENLIHQPDGHILRVLIAPYPMGGLFYLFEDVTDKLTLEQRFNTLIAVQKETIDHLHEGIVVLGIDFRLRLANRAFEELWDLKGISQLQSAPHASDLLEHIQNFFSGSNTIEVFKNQLFDILDKRVPQEVSLKRSDEKIIQFTYVPLPDGSHLLSFVDVSDTTKFEQALQERNQALEQASRLKSSFISNVSYELRAPLNTIVGFTEMLLNQYFGSLNEKQTDYSRNILDSAHRLMGLINDMIDMANIEAGQLTLSYSRIPLESFLNSARGLVFHRAHDQGLEVIVQNLVAIDSFYGDERRLKQALFNLLINAVKYTPSGGKISLVADLSGDRRYLLLNVKDTGIGFQQENPEFNAYTIAEITHSQKPGGVGLGLALVKSLIELHKGTVSIKSEPGKGTTVTCSLPLSIPDISLQEVLS